MLPPAAAGDGSSALGHQAGEHHARGPEQVGLGLGLPEQVGWALQFTRLIDLHILSLYFRWPFRVKVIDFGSATLVSTGNATSYLQSRYYRYL